MFSSNDTPAEEFQLADKLGAIINLDDLTLVDYLEQSIGHIPQKVCCRYNPGGVFTLSETREGFQVMDNPGDAKYGMTRAQIAEAFTRLHAMGAKEFGIHAFLASNTLSNAYYPALARILFQLAVDLQMRPACISRSSISPAVSVSPISRTSPQMTSPPSVTVYVRRMKRSWSPPVWVMWRCTRNWAGSCWGPTAIW